jgi:hypothetical protein
MPFVVDIEVAFVPPPAIGKVPKMGGEKEPCEINDAPTVADGVIDAGTEELLIERIPVPKVSI